MRGAVCLFHLLALWLGEDFAECGFMADGRVPGRLSAWKSECLQFDGNNGKCLEAEGLEAQCLK